MGRKDGLAVSSIKAIKGGVTAAKGFRASAVFAGIKATNKGRDDMALVASEVPSVGAGVFTTNRVKAAPVRVSMAHLRSPSTCAVLLNSGNANACTGPCGIAAAKSLASSMAEALDCGVRRVLVCSTGRIGVALPVEKMSAKLPELAVRLSAKGGPSAARAIMTSDSFPKEYAVEVRGHGGTFRIGGMAKGAGMINPNMATMLCVITTDAKISKGTLQNALHHAVERTFNRITVDGDMSTNDTVLALANGASGGSSIKSGSPEYMLFVEALGEVCLRLAHMIVEDGEGVSKFVTVQVRGASSLQAARKVAEAVANSVLVKCAWAGNDPNWGRILDAAGYSGVRIREELVDIYYDGVAAVRGGTAAPTPKEKLVEAVSRKKFTVTVDLHQGRAFYTVYTTDLTEKFVELNLSE
ncbi:MAG: bifunctional glutamate N-acetyltransferase/amino-acid acetyltransferase ArgJ [Chthoniobacterales bacterium]|nr:bifunctional glutamate N-acetyltransferase/amino-acid acetyltransferase ArgJ [Chthoniobacterales bacterium]